MKAKTDYLNESRNALAVLSMLYAGNASAADDCLCMVQEPARYIAALHSLAVQFLRVVDQLAVAANVPNANAAALLGQLRDQLAQSESIEI
jgi:hypothetical protein